MLGKLGEVLKADVGSLVKDAGKVLNTDMGDIAKGAGKVLNADMGQIAKGAGKVLNTDMGQIAKGAGKLLNTDLGDLLRSNGDTSAAAAAAAQSAANTATPAPAAPVAAPAPKARDPRSTRLTEDIAVRVKRTAPTTHNLNILLPEHVGEFSRPGDKPAGKLAIDPVVAEYTGSGEIIAVEVGHYWDTDEARERIAQINQTFGAAGHPSDDGTWMVGKGAQGITFAWARDCYVYAASTTRDAAALLRFLDQFPY